MRQKMRIVNPGLWHKHCCAILWQKWSGTAMSDSTLKQICEVAQQMVDAGWEKDPRLARIAPYAALYFAGEKSADWLKARVAPELARVLVAARPR
jgi:hypothetical protein